MLQMAEEEAHKVGVHPFMVVDGFVREGGTGREAALLQPKDRGKRTRKKDVLRAAKEIRCSPNVDCSSEIHRRAQSALRLTQGMVSMASKRYSR